jgi:phosphotransferase system IIA component
VLAPFNGTLLQVKSGGCEFILKAKNGLKVLINLAVPDSQTLTHTHIAQLNGSKITKGQRLAYFDLRELDTPILASLIILNGHDLGTFHYSHPQVNAGVDTLLTIIKKK